MIKCIISFLCIGKPYKHILMGYGQTLGPASLTLTPEIDTWYWHLLRKHCTHPRIWARLRPCIFNQLYTYLDQNNLLSEQQYGFRANHSAELAAINLVDYIVHQIDWKLTPVNIYIDLSNTFDTLNFKILLYKVHYYRITDIPLKLL